MLKNQETILYSIPSGNVDRIRQALDNGADVNHIHDPDGTGMRQSYLHMAAAHGNERVLNLLVERGANVNARTRDGETPLHSAAVCNQKNSAQILLRSGALLNAEDSNGVTPIEHAVKNNHSEMVRTFMERGALKNERVIQMLDETEANQEIQVRFLSVSRIVEQRQRENSISGNSIKSPTL